MDEVAQSKKKILYIITKSNFGGAQKHVFDVATGIPQEMFEVVVALGGEGLLKTKLEDAGVRTISITTLGRDVSLKRDALTFFTLYSIIKREKPDIVHLHSPKAAGLGAVASRLLKVPTIIYTVHGWAFNEDRNFISRVFIAFFSWITCVFSHKIITITEKETDQTKKFPFVARKVVYIPNGITPPVYLDREEARHFFEEKLQTDLKDKTIVGTISELHTNKGLTYTIEALEKLHAQFPRLICIIIGEGVEKERLTQRIQTKGLGSVVYLMGFLHDAARYLTGFDMFTLTSVKEGLPYVLLEAGAARVPCLTTSVGGIPDVITDMKSGILVKTKNAEEIAHGIAYLLEHPLKAHKYGEALREKVLSTFSKATMLEKIVAVYTSKRFH